jgi:hypothetical protein|tara:strand:+ start:11300 stop:11485 length:186 start_codon:yes stop_codon:yes gene_type:complete
MMKIDIDVIKGCIAIIDICSNRGAFKGEELQGVGGLRQSLLAALEPKDKQVNDEKIKKEKK